MKRTIAANEARRVRIKAYSQTELAKIYEVDARTLKKWMNPFLKVIGERQGRFYTIPQVKIIFDKLSLPSSVVIDD